MAADDGGPFADRVTFYRYHHVESTWLSNNLEF